MEDTVFDSIWEKRKSQWHERWNFSDEWSNRQSEFLGLLRSICTILTDECYTLLRNHSDMHLVPLLRFCLLSATTGLSGPGRSTSTNLSLFSWLDVITDQYASEKVRLKSLGNKKRKWFVGRYNLNYGVIIAVELATSILKQANLIVSIGVWIGKGVRGWLLFP